LSWPLPISDISAKDASWPLVADWSEQDLAAVSGAIA
jgi:hypothetical protein